MTTTPITERFKTTHLTSTQELRDFISSLSNERFITVDTEFMREKTYYTILCLLQVASSNQAVTIDCQAPDMDLKPFLEVLFDPSIKKVFHAAQQDLEIFYHLSDGKLPQNFFDTQVAAMVLGYGGTVSYETLVQTLTKGKLDKSQRFTNWSKRPLTKAQLNYALDDVTYLRDIYEKLDKDLSKRDRHDWVQEEVERLLSPDTYEVDHLKLLQKIRFRSPKAIHYMRGYELIKFRESTAQRKNNPRQTILKDDTIAALAMLGPTSEKDVTSLRSNLSAALGDAKLKGGVLKAIHQANLAMPEDYPLPVVKKAETPVASGTQDLLKILLKHQAESYGVAEKMIALSKDLIQLARYGQEAQVACLKGWRYDIFGSQALALLEGHLSFSIKDGRLQINQKTQRR